MARSRRGLLLSIGISCLNRSPKAEKPNIKTTTATFNPPGREPLKKNIVFTEAIGFSIHYFRYIILHYFKTMEGAIVFPNFTEDVEVWLEDTEVQHDQYRQYNKFTIKVQYRQVSEGYEMVLAVVGNYKCRENGNQECRVFGNNVAEKMAT